MDNILQECIETMGIEDGDIIKLGNEFYKYRKLECEFLNINDETWLDSDSINQVLRGNLPYEIYKQKQDFTYPMFEQCELISNKVDKKLNELVKNF